MNDKLRALKPYDPDIDPSLIRLDANESCFALPSSVMAEIADAVRLLPLNRYPDPFARSLCEAYGRYAEV
ncbi:MAG: histidinol-phosphate aminotransferase, partial [Clostridia bacterium]|nr:histidinol-phosphate aminotransferase [Clostridia bacterium]